MNFEIGLSRADASQLPVSEAAKAYAPVVTEAEATVNLSLSGPRVAELVAESWRREHNALVDVINDLIVLMRDQQLVEWVFEDGGSTVAHLEEFRRIRDSGFKLSIIVPVSEMGTAHDALWGTGIDLYGWINRGEETVVFVGPEIT